MVAIDLRDRGVKVRSLPEAEAEAQWTRYLEADDGSPEAFFGQVLTMFAAWVADQELESTKRRTREGLERARQRGKDLGPPKKFRPHPGGGDAEDAPGRRQLPADRRRLRVFPQHCAADVAEVAPNRGRPRMGIFGDVSGTDQTITFSRGSGFYHRTTCRWVNLNFDKAHWTVTNDVMEAVLVGKGPMAGPAYHRRPIETR